MSDIEKYELQWQSLRYGVDMLDLGWLLAMEEFGPAGSELHETERERMKIHRQRLCAMADEALANKHAAEKAAGLWVNP